MKNLSSWRSVRLSETALERQLRQRHTLWLHGLCLGTLVLALMWAVAHAQLVLGSDSLALRYLVTLGAGYLGYLLLLRLWAASLLRDDRRGDGFDGGLDLPLPRGSGGTESPAPEVVPFEAGGGGDFGGGGAEASFDAPGDAAGEATGQAFGKVAEGALEVAGGADEGAVVVIPVVAIFLIGVALLFGTGSLLLLYFGSTPCWPSRSSLPSATPPPGPRSACRARAGSRRPYGSPGNRCWGLWAAPCCWARRSTTSFRTRGPCRMPSS